MPQKFIKWCSENLFTQLTESPTHKSGNILDLLLCNRMSLDKNPFHSIGLPLTDTNDHYLISFNINVDNGIQLEIYTLNVTKQILKVLISIY